MSNVKLAIRVRPFSEREIKDSKSKEQVVRVVDNNTVTITNTKVSGRITGDSRERIREYNADYTFDSSLPPEHPEHASQEKVFEAIGREVLQCMSRGVSACVLAYGQSATGKTHTMMGTAEDPGLIPRICHALGRTPDGELEEITVSFLEIYNERVHDLLQEDEVGGWLSLPRRKGNLRKDLRVREHPATGPYVQNLRRVLVRGPEALLAAISRGAARRRTAATKRNAFSSRSHALIELRTSRAKLHLADLAGSEKACFESGYGRQLKEGSNINKSLVALSNVISALVSGKGKRRFVPYRDSALTWLLKDCFTGGASAFIVATVSPSGACFSESASTLRWSSRARLLPNSRNSPKLLPRTVLDQLLAALRDHHIEYISSSGTLIFDPNYWISKSLFKVPATEMADKQAESNQALSTTSSLSSGSSERIISYSPNIKTANVSCSEEGRSIDKVFGPALERASSGNNLKIVAPLRHKRKYRSHEVLLNDSPITHIEKYNREDNSLNKDGAELVTVDDNNSETKHSSSSSQTHIPIEHENKRAEIVASVTERLYCNMKKKEDAIVSKVESVVDKKIIEPLHELKICTNARQRLVELSHRALRGRRRIGIPAHTQTRSKAVRVREQGVDAQTDLESWFVTDGLTTKMYRSVSIETIPNTPRCKEIAVGPKAGSLHVQEKATITDKSPTFNSLSIMTDYLPKSDSYTQTPVVPPPRKKRSASACTKYSKSSHTFTNNDVQSSPFISINIIQACDSNESASMSDDSIEEAIVKKPFNVTPDIISNHQSTGQCFDSITSNNKASLKNHHVTNTISYLDENVQTPLQAKNTEFSESDENSPSPLPKVSGISSKRLDATEISNMLIGGETDEYSYNRRIPSVKQPAAYGKTVKFKSGEIAKSSPLPYRKHYTENRDNFVFSDDSDDSFSTDCKKPSQTNKEYKHDETVYLSESTDPDVSYEPNISSQVKLNQYSKAKFYEDFLPCNEEFLSFRPNKIQTDQNTFVCNGTNNRQSINFENKRRFFEDKIKENVQDYNSQKINKSFNEIQKNITMSCDRLYNLTKLYEPKFQRRPEKVSSNNYSSKERTYKQFRFPPSDYLHDLIQLRRDLVDQIQNGK